MKDDLATNSVFLLPDLNIDVGDGQLRVWPLEVLYGFYFLNPMWRYEHYKCEDWGRMGIPDYVLTHASEKLFERVQIEYAKNPKAYVTEAVSDENPVYRKLLPYNMLIEVI